MDYITVNKDLLLTPQSKSANMEALLLYYIRTKCNKNAASAIGEKKIQDELDLPESTLEGYIRKLKEYTEILLIKTLTPSDRNDRVEIEKILGTRYEGDARKKNVYYFHEPERFYLLKPSIIYRKDIEKNEIKGFLIRLACLCEPGTTKIYTANCRKEKANISSMAKELNMSRNKAANLLNECEALGLVKSIPRGYIILEDSFMLNTSKTDNDIIYNTLYKYCLDKGAVPPDRYKFTRGRQSVECDSLRMLEPAIFSKWSIYQKENREKKEPLLQFDEYIEKLLSMRFPTLPEEPHWEYFKKAILNIEPKKSSQEQWHFTL